MLKLECPKFTYVFSMGVFNCLKLLRKIPGLNPKIGKNEIFKASVVGIVNKTPDGLIT